MIFYHFCLTINEFRDHSGDHRCGQEMREQDLRCHIQPQAVS